MLIPGKKKRLLSLVLAAAAVALSGYNISAYSAPLLTPIGSYDSGRGEGAAKIVSFDARTERVFVVNAVDSTVDVLDLSDPERPVRVGSLDVGAVAPNLGSANSVATYKGLVAVAVEAAPKQDPGLVAFYKASDLRLIGKVTVGALPSMVAFTPDGETVLVANEGEPSDDYTRDPEGSISVIDGSNGYPVATVRTASFHAFNDKVDQLRIAGVRIFGPNASVAQDLEPEYITVSDDSKTAWVSLQENNAIAVVDIASATVTAIKPLGYKSYLSGPATLKTFNFPELPVIGYTTVGQTLRLGGFSGLYFEGKTDDGKLHFITHTDRGPDTSPIDADVDGIKERPFALPYFQPRWQRFTLTPTNGEIILGEPVMLRKPTGVAMSGRPNLLATPGLAYSDERPINLSGGRLALDTVGADMEGIVRDPTDGTYWMVDEYRPSIYHFTASGALLGRYVPVGSNVLGETTGIQVLPKELAQRRNNRGFEAIAYAGGQIFAFMQSPIDNPDTADDANSKASRWTRIIQFDTATRTTVAQYVYPLEARVGPWANGNNTDKIGDAVALDTAKLLVLERDSNTHATASKYIFKIDLTGATNLETLDDSIVGPGGTLDTMTADELIEAGIVPVRKGLFVNLATLGYLPNDKPEGLALVHRDPNEMVLAVINDNDFGLSDDRIFLDGSVNLQNPPVPVQLGLITIKLNPIDPSDRNGGPRLRPWPVVGMYQPRSIASYSVNGQTYIVTANEGDSRDYSGFSEETRVGKAILDPIYFPNAAALQIDEVLGRLKITKANGDTGQENGLRKLYSYGTRSFSIWNSDIKQVADSGADFARNTIDNDGNWISSASEGRNDDQGSEPEGVVVGRANGRTYAFIGLERTGGVMAYDVSNPARPMFKQWAHDAAHISPEGLDFVPAMYSPNQKPLLLVAHEMSGTVLIYQVNPE